MALLITFIVCSLLLWFIISVFTNFVMRKEEVHKWMPANLNALRWSYKGQFLTKVLLQAPESQAAQSPVKNSPHTTALCMARYTDNEREVWNWWILWTHTIRGASMWQNYWATYQKPEKVIPVGYFHVPGLSVLKETFGRKENDKHFITLCIFGAWPKKKNLAVHF